ncbi:hypothetical protein L596_015853 [Steinernema carpocapsae]|uniref:Uncharacterized protein n=1 Tax=Steinernema carpocapsae TaxID=34508 RepID=A0A4U5NG99_STECR|nr:hypothetical protein L596_015853 [Steinernema carpocapsae]
MGEDLECRQKPKRLELTYNDQMKIRMFCNPNWSISAPPSEPDHKPVQSNSRKDLHNPKGKSNGKMKRQHTCSRWQQREPVPMKRQMPAHPMMLPPQPPTVSPWARPPLRWRPVILRRSVHRALLRWCLCSSHRASAYVHPSEHAANDRG